MRPFDDYRDMEEDDKSFLLRLLFHDFLATVDYNRLKKKGPQFLKTIIDNDMQEHVRLQNYEACVVIRDMKNMFNIEINNHDDII
jgi:hypothetical protein